MVEIKAYEEQQKGLEREAKTRQEVSIEVETRNREIHRLETKIRKTNRKEELKEHKEVQDAFEKQMELARIDDELFSAEIRNQTGAYDRGGVGIGIDESMAEVTTARARLYRRLSK